MAIKSLNVIKSTTVQPMTTSSLRMSTFRTPTDKDKASSMAPWQATHWEISWLQTTPSIETGLPCHPSVAKQFPCRSASGPHKTWNITLTFEKYWGYRKGVDPYLIFCHALQKNQPKFPTFDLCVLLLLLSDTTELSHRLVALQRRRGPWLW